MLRSHDCLNAQSVRAPSNKRIHACIRHRLQCAARLALFGRRGPCTMAGSAHSARLAQYRCSAAGAGSGAPGAGARSTRVVSLDTGGQVEQLSVPLLDGSNELARADLAFPLGVVFEARGGLVVVAEITAGGAAGAAGERARAARSVAGIAHRRAAYTALQACGGARCKTRQRRCTAEALDSAAAMPTRCRDPKHANPTAPPGIREGDVLRATSAAMMRMTYPTAQLMFGGAPDAACRHSPPAVGAIQPAAGPAALLGLPAATLADSRLLPAACGRNLAAGTAHHQVVDSHQGG